MFCEECGKKLIRPQALYCPYCGHKVNHEPAVNPAQPAQSTAPAPQTVSPESDAQGVPVAVSMQVSESPIESMPELQPIVPDTVEEAPAEEVPSVPEIPEQEAPDAETAEEPDIPNPAATDEPSHQQVHTEPEKAPEPAKEEPEEEEYISTASAFTSFELEEIQRNLKKKITPEPLFDKEKLAAELYNNLYENLYENLRENIKREILKELEEERKNSASEKKPGFFKRH